MIEEVDYHELFVHSYFFEMMKIDYAGNYSPLRLKNYLYFFPISNKVSKEGIMADDRFMTRIFGREQPVALKG